MIDINSTIAPATMTAQPFRRGYREYAPCAALRPFVRCFWTGAEQTGRLIIPDLCADIIFDMGSYHACFCGVSDRAFVSDKEEECFGIRFYAWTAALFAEDSLRGTKNGGFAVGMHFRRVERELLSRIMEAETTAQRIALSENYLLLHLHERRSSLYDEAIGALMRMRGTGTVDGLSKELHVSVRQLERIFLEYSGLSPKKTAKLIRYQYLWRDILSEQDFKTAEKAMEYGYTDQSHLLKEFLCFHTMYPGQARACAMKDVAFLQDKCPGL